MNNMIKEAFGNILAEDALKRSTREFLFQKTNGYRQYNSFSYRKQAAAAFICLFFAFCGWEGYSVFFTSISTISVDVNPSIEFEVNRFDKVINVQSYNEGGDRVLSKVNVRFANYKDAIDLVLNDEIMAQYLKKKMPVIVTVFGEDAKRTDEMVANLAAYTAYNENIHCSAGDIKDAEAAHSMGFSCGKYRVYMELHELDPNVDAEEVKGLTMHQIQNRIDELSGSAPINDAGHGHGYEYGHGHGHE